MKTISKQFVLCTYCILLAASLSNASSQSDVLKKWGVKPGQVGGGVIADDQRRQPLTGSYSYWLAAKFIPGFLDDKTILQFVEKEIDYAKKYKKYGGDQKPWLSYSEVKDRHPKMAAPEYVDRYKADIRKFTKGLSTRVVGKAGLGRPIYNQSTGMMHFGAFNSENDKPVNPVRTNLAGQAAYTKDYANIVAIFGAEGVDEIARQTVDRKIGSVTGSSEKVRLTSGVRVPMVISRGSANMVGVAFDKDMDIKGIKMSKSKAERFLNKYENVRFMTRINFTIKGVLVYFHKTMTYKGRGVVFLADVEDVTIYSARSVSGRLKLEKKVHARYKASDFKIPTVTFATLKAQHDAGIQAKQAESAKAKQKLHQDIAKLKQTCSASRSVDCYQELCGKIKETGNNSEYQSCNRELQQANKKKYKAIRESSKAQWATINAKGAAKNENIRQNMATERSCQKKYTGYVVQPWMPVKGTPEFKAAMTACQNEPIRDVYGPDILGLRLGMPLNDANSFIRRQSVNKNTTLKDTRPFEKAALHWTKDANHGIAVFSVVNGEHERVAAVSRRLYMNGKKTTADQVVNGLRKKYGRELWSKGNHTLLWAFPKGSKKPSAKMCSGLVKLIEPRAGWNRAWSSGKKSSESSKQRQSTSMARVGRQQECMAKHGMPSSPEAMQAFASCMQGLTTNAPAPSQSGGKSGSNTRLPMMIPANGNPKLYEKYKACGPVIIARTNKAKNGTLKDMSLVLFDPDWIARQPAFAFKSGKGGDQIEF